MDLFCALCISHYFDSKIVLVLKFPVQFMKIVVNSTATNFSLRWVKSNMFDDVLHVFLTILYFFLG